MRHRIGHGDLGEQLLQFDELWSVGHGGEFGLGEAGSAAGDFDKRIEIRERHLDLEHEAVELGFGQRVGAFHFHGVLRGQHEKGFWHQMALAAGGHAAFLHDFEQCGLGLGRGTIDFIHQQQILEHRAFFIAQSSVAFFVFTDDVRAEDVRRHQVWRTLHPARLQAHHLGKRAHEVGFAETGNAFQQHMPTGEDGDQHIAKQFIVTDDGFLHLGLEVGEQGAEISVVRHGAILASGSDCARLVSPSGRESQDSWPCGSPTCVMRVI